MADVHTPDQRARNMRAITGKNTSPEIKLRRILHAAGFRFRLHSKDLPGRPDIVLPKHKVAIFVHGCFWHRHSCPMFKVPATRTEFWLDKIGKNQTRDAAKEALLRVRGVRVLYVWECAIRGRGRLSDEDVLEQFNHWLVSGAETGSIEGAFS